MKLNVTNNGKRQIGAVVGTEEYRKKYVITKKKCVKKLKLPSKIPKFYLQTAYFMFTLGFRQRFNYIFQPILSHPL